MSWLLLTCISVICRAVYGVMSKVLSRRAESSAYTQVVLLSTVCALIAVPAIPLFGGITADLSKISWLVVLLVAGGQGLGNIFYFTAMKKTDQWYGTNSLFVDFDFQYVAIITIPEPSS